MKKSIKKITMFVSLAIVLSMVLSISSFAKPIRQYNTWYYNDIMNGNTPCGTAYTYADKYDADTGYAKIFAQSLGVTYSNVGVRMWSRYLNPEGVTTTSYGHYGSSNSVGDYYYDATTSSAIDYIEAGQYYNIYVIKNILRVKVGTNWKSDVMRCDEINMHFWDKTCPSMWGDDPCV